MRRLYLYIKTVFCTVPAHIRLERFMEQAVFTVCIGLALRNFIRIENQSYMLFLLSGVTSWFYFQEVLLDITGKTALFSAHIKQKKSAPAQIAFIQAVASLPTLLMFFAITVAAHAVNGFPLKNPLLLCYLLFCNVHNAVMQASLICALNPLLKSKANTGLSVMRMVFFWTTPFAWPMMETGGIFGVLAQTNPQYYLAHGMRMALTSGTLPDATHTLLFFVFSTGAGAIALLLSVRVWRSPISITVSPS